MSDSEVSRSVELASVGCTLVGFLAVVADAVGEFALPLETVGPILAAVGLLVFGVANWTAGETAKGAVLAGGACCLVALRLAQVARLGTAAFAASIGVILVGTGLVGFGVGARVAG